VPWCAWLLSSALEFWDYDYDWPSNTGRVVFSVDLPISQ